MILTIIFKILVNDHNEYIYIYTYVVRTNIYIYTYIHTLVKHQRTCLLQQTEKNVHLITCSFSQCQVIEVQTEIHMAVSQSTLESAVAVTNSFWWPQVLSHHKQNQFMIRLAMTFMMVFEKCSLSYNKTAS